jgi:small-conductance mechanosensitive channel
MTQLRTFEFRTFLDIVASINTALAAAFLLLMAGLTAPRDATAAQPAGVAVPLVVGHRTIHVFRVPLGAFSAEERMEGARHRIQAVLTVPGEGWTSVKPTEGGFLVSLDNKPMFTVADADARKLAGETPEDLANQASHVLQRVWAESREKRDVHASLIAAAKAAGALLLLIGALFALLAVARAVREALARRLAAEAERLSAAGAGARVGEILLGIVMRAFVICTWLLGFLAVFLFITYALMQFALTRPIGEELSGSLTGLLAGALNATAGALPGLFVAVVVFLIARMATQISSALFDQISAGRLNVGVFDSHTAPATRRIVNFVIWLFALAMAYPYLPGSQSEAFKGISVILGIMVSIGAAGLVGQIASGMMLVYTRALLVGEYVRIQDSEGTVTHIGLFVTRLRTGLGEEISLPNSLVLANVTRNFSRTTGGRGYVLDTTITIGYDTPWRQVHAMLMEATRSVPEIEREPEPYVVQTSLADFYVAYRLVVRASADTPATRAQVAGNLHAAIQDTFNKYGVQIMSPHYRGDPATPKVVPEAQWHTLPASRENSGHHA